MIRNVRNVLFAVALGAAAPALASVSPGAQVKGPSGEVVGTVASVDGTFYVVKTDKHEVRLPSSSFTPHEGALLFGMTRDQLNAEVEKALEAANAKLVPGVKVAGSGGVIVGTIEAIDDQFATIKLTSGKLAKIPRAGIAAGADGAVIGMTAAQLQAAVSASSGS